MQCTHCGTENPERAKFCIECAAPFPRRCPQCGSENPPQAKFCAECGTALTTRPVKRGAESGERKAKNKEKGKVRTQESKGAPRPTLHAPRAEAERRQLTVLFCDLVGSTMLSEQLDPEEYREVVRSYQESCAEVIRRYVGHTAQHLGDGLLVYFSYPAAHEDDAQRAVRTGLEILAGLQSLNARLQPTLRARLPHPIQVRIGIHTGLVVVGEIGSSEKREILAMGETPNIAARLQGLAEPDTVVISGATYRLVQGLFECQDRGPQELKGISTPLPVYCVVGEGAAQSRFEAAVSKGLTPLVGREEELGLLQQRWERAKEGEGQVVLLSGEPGIGKSRLMQELKEQLAHEGVTRLEFRCSPYHQNSAFYPIIDHLQRLLQFARDDSPTTKLEKLQHTLSHYRFPQADTLPLLASLLSLPHPEGYPSIMVSPQKQKEKTQAALVAWLVEEAEKATVYCAWEDLHWADPSSLEVLTLFLDQVPTARLYLLLTCRPEFTLSWDSRSYLTQLTLSRLGRQQVEVMVEKVTGGKTLPSEMLQQIVAKTDGVPLFVEELTKSVVESVGAHGRAPLQFAIPATLQDSLMARLDRLGPTKEIAQLGATIGREFSYELLHAVSPLDEAMLQQGLRRLVEAELLYQRGLPPQATYFFKHALIQDAAYQSLLKSTRQQYHTKIAQVLEERFPEVLETQPELLAQHYTAAGLISQAIPYWQQAGQRALERSASGEAIGHLTQGLDLLKALPDTPDRGYQELMLQITLGTSFMAIRGYAAPEVKEAYTRALELCRQMEDTPRLSGVLGGLAGFYMGRGELRTARELGEQYLTLAQRGRRPTLLLWAHNMRGENLLYLGESALAREHLEQSMALYDPQRHHLYIRGGIHDPGVACLGNEAMALWCLGYPDQALKKIRAAISLAQELSHSLSLARALEFAALIHQYRREGQAAQEQAEATITVCTEQGFPFYLAHGTILRGWALAEQGQAEEGISQIRQGLVVYQATGGDLFRPYFLALLAEAHGEIGQVEEGLSALSEALMLVNKTEERFYEAELYRIKGELTLQQFNVQRSRFKVEESSESEVKTSLGQVQDKSQTSLEQVRTSQDQSEVSNTQHPAPSTQAEVEREAEEYFLKAIEIARRQQAKSLELRATMSLVRLRQQQATQYASRTTQHEARTMLDAARNMLSEIYGWFTEGFDTKDLQEAKALLQELA